MPTPFATRLGLTLPILQGPMTGSDTPALAAAVSFGDPSVLGVVVDTGTVLSAPKSTS